MRLRLFCLIALLFAATANAQQPLPDEEAMTPEEAAQMQAARDATQSYYPRIATELAASGEPRDLAFAATLLQIGTTSTSPDGPAATLDVPSRPSPRDPRIDQWRRLASARAGKDLLANALLVHADSADAESVRQSAIERWRQLEPDNLGPLVYAKSPVTEWLPQARKQARFDLHYYEQARWMQAALRAHPPGAEESEALLGGQDMPAGEASAIAAMGILAAISMPELAPLSEACRDDVLESSPERLADCRHIARVMTQASDTYLGANFGVVLLKRTATGPEEDADADGRRRRMDWQMQQWGRVSGDPSLGGSAQFVRLLGDPQVRNEQDLAERVLTEADVPLDPPAGWTSPWQR